MSIEPLFLGQQSAVPARPEDAVIDTVPAPPGNVDATEQTLMGGAAICARYIARFTCPEFTSLCPVTGQPDFAKIVIDYMPYERLIESKALKLFLCSFRNHGAYHESCTAMIGDRLFEAATPIWLRVTAFWYPRGGIPIDVFWERGVLPRGVSRPELDYKHFNGR